MTLDPPAPEPAPTRRSLRQAALSARGGDPVERAVLPSDHGPGALRSRAGRPGSGQAAPSSRPFSAAPTSALPAAVAPSPSSSDPETVTLTVAAARELAARLIAGESEQIATANVLRRRLSHDRDEAGGIESSFPDSGVSGSLPAVASDETIQGAAAAVSESGTRVSSSPAARPVRPAIARRRMRWSFRRISAVGVPAGAMGFAALLAIATVLPTQAIAGASAESTAASLVTAEGKPVDRGSRDGIQAFVSGTDVPRATLSGAEGFTAVSQAQVAAESGIRFSDSLYTNDRAAKIQWPYVVGVAMSSPFGMRDGVMHEGIDLVPGNGAPIQAIADGTVRLASESDGGYGVGVYIDHLVDGKLVTSHYAHMQYASLKVKTGDTVKVGDPVGRTGDTGHSFGPHLHFELIVDGTKIDPLPWLLAHAGRR